MVKANRVATSGFRFFLRLRSLPCVVFSRVVLVKRYPFFFLFFYCGTIWNYNIILYIWNYYILELFEVINSCINLLILW